MAAPPAKARPSQGGVRPEKLAAKLLELAAAAEGGDGGARKPKPVKVGPARILSPLHRMPVNANNKGWKCVG
jgi:hypothetical protein